jgi:hypothetical protein
MRDKRRRGEPTGQICNQALKDCTFRLSGNQPDSDPGQKTNIIFQLLLLSEKLLTGLSQGLQRIENSLE